MWAEVAVVGVKLAFVLVVMLTTVPIMVWVERRGSALIQDRLGPNRVGPFGLLQPVIDVVKLLTKENLRPEGVHTFLYLLAPAIAIAISLSTFIAVPFARDSGLTIFGQPVGGFIVAPNLNIGVLYIFAVVNGFALGMGVGESPLMAELFGLSSHGLILGVVHLGFTIGGAVGPVVTGYIFDITGGYQAAFLVCAAFCVFSTILVAIMGRPKS